MAKAGRAGGGGRGVLPPNALASEHRNQTGIPSCEVSERSSDVRSAAPRAPSPAIETQRWNISLAGLRPCVARWKDGV